MYNDDMLFARQVSHQQQHEAPPPRHGPAPVQCAGHHLRGERGEGTAGELSGRWSHEPGHKDGKV